LFYSGFIFNFTGGVALISMNNYGEDYEKFYTHQAEVSAANWLQNNYDGSRVYTDSPGRNKLWAFDPTINQDNILIDTFPEVISVNSYVYTTYLNTVGGKGLYTQNGDQYAYTYPTEFLDENKSKIYTTGISDIYR
jgi:uncharacterized membrane protein